MLADFDTLTHLDALRRPGAAPDLQRAPDAETALALQGGAYRDITAHRRLAAYRALRAHLDIPADTQVAAAVQALRHQQVPVGTHIAVHVQAAERADIAGRPQVFANLQAAPDANAGLGSQTAADAQHAVHLDRAMHQQTAGEHDSLRFQRIDFKHRLGRPELIHQPAGIRNPPGCHERIEQRLVVGAFLKMAHEPAETIGTGIFLPDKLTRDIHCPHSLSELLITGEAASSGQWTAGKISAVRTDCCIKAP